MPPCAQPAGKVNRLSGQDHLISDEKLVHANSSLEVLNNRFHHLWQRIVYSALFAFFYGGFQLIAWV